jgi:hypothetical protein
MKKQKDNYSYNPSLIITNGVLAFALVFELVLIVMSWNGVATIVAGLVMAISWIAFIAGRGGEEAIAAMSSTIYFIAIACAMFSYASIHYLGLAIGIIGIVVQVMMSIARSEGRI